MLYSSYSHSTKSIQVQDRYLLHLVRSKQGRGVSACISPRDGAELCSLKVHEPSGEYELLYNANNWAPIEGWPGRAPWLWPVAGRAYAPSTTSKASPEPCTWAYRGQVRPMQAHGFARSRAWTASPPGRASRGNAAAHMTLAAERNDHGSYPFRYHLDASTYLSNTGLAMTLRVNASQDNPDPMPFTAGNHLTFDLSSWWGPDWLNGVVHGLGGRAWTTNDLMLADKPVKLPRDRVHLSNSFLANAIIPARMGKPVSLVSPDTTKRIDIVFTTSDPPSDDATIWVTHLDPAMRFFCIEPWTGWPNAINSGRGRVELEPGGTWEMMIKLHVKTSASYFEEQVTPPVTAEISKPSIQATLNRPTRIQTKALLNQKD